MGVFAAEATVAAKQSGQIEIDTVVDVECYYICETGVGEVCLDCSWMAAASTKDSQWAGPSRRL